MTQSSHEKVFKQLRAKPAKLKKFLKHNAPKERTRGEKKHICRRCGRTGGHITRYGLHLCRQCFRDIAPKIGFKQFD
jgi:small subunit ribosomal protein S14